MRHNWLVAAAGGMASVLAAVVILTAPLDRWWVAAGTGFVALTAVVVCLVVMRAARRLYRVISRVEARVISNHKRASEWEHRLSSSLGAKSGSGGASWSAPAVVQATAKDKNWKNHPQARLLVDSGVFDAEYYAALTNGSFVRAYDAASHFISINAPKGVMPHPFLGRTHLPEGVRHSLAHGDVKPLLAHLRSEEAYAGPVGALFHPGHSLVDRQAAHLHPGGVLGVFLETLDEEVLLPVPPNDAATGSRAAEVRRAIIDHARGVHEGRRLAGPREVTHWDADAERIWLRDTLVDGGPLPAVSVVMPVKDRVDLIGRAIGSVQRQTHDRWQLIVVDDGSTDGTFELVSRLSAEDPRVTIVRSTGTGVSAARNTGLRMATGAYVAFLDSDNEWVPHYLRAMVQAMVRDGLGAAYSGVSVHTATGETRYRAFVGGRDHLLMLNHIDMNVLVVRADVVSKSGGFDESMKRWVDHDFALKVSAESELTLLPFIGCVYDHSEEAVDRITVRESDHWQWVSLARHWARWDQAAETVPGRLSVVVLTYNDSDMTIPCVRSVLADADTSGLDVEVVVVDNGSRLEVGQAILTGVGVNERVRYRRLPRNLNFAIGCNVGAIMATGEHVLFLNNDTVVRSGALSHMLRRIADPAVIGVQPLLVYGDETIQTAGTVFSAADSLPGHLLTGHPPADALPLKNSRFDAVTAAALLMRATDVRALSGFDPIFVNGMEDVDLCLRAREELGGYFAVEPSAVVTHLESKTPGRGKNVLENRRLFLEKWRSRLPGPQHELYEAAGFKLAAVGTDGREIPGPRPIVVRDPADTRLRWGIKIGSIPGARGDQWGDTHFAESLRLSLEKLGHRAVVHRNGAHDTHAAAFDDVALVIRGLDRVRPMPGKVNILWVISHPDDVTVQELREFDVVFAASIPWSRSMSEISGRAVLPLFQATDVERFNTMVDPIPVDVPLFVGGIHAGREREVVTAALDADVPIAVYGPGWEGKLPAGVLRGEYIDNKELAAYYRGSTRVLADHWALMAKEGFIQNRLFDAVASGCRVISDPVEGITETFGRAVQTFENPERLAELCGPEGDVEFPDDDELERIAAKVRAEHSFDARAVALTDRVQSVLAAERGLDDLNRV